MHILLAYETQDGQTAKIATHIADVLQGLGNKVDLVELPNQDVGVAAYDAFIIGSSVHFGRHAKIVLDFVKAHADVLAARPSAFFSVSLTAKDQHIPEQQAQLTGYLNDFIKLGGWQPNQVVTFAGALKYSQYNYIERQLLRWISGLNGGDTDISRDFEYTNWSAVTQFAEQFSRFANDLNVHVVSEVVGGTS